MTPSAACAASTAAAGSVVPCSRKAAKPITAEENASPSANSRSTSRSTASGAALISGPMPSPSRTRSRVALILSRQALADAVGAPGSFGHEESDVGLGRDKAHALADEGELSLQIAIAAKA